MMLKELLNFSKSQLSYLCSEIIKMPLQIPEKKIKNRYIYIYTPATLSCT